MKLSPARTVWAVRSVYALLLLLLFYSCSGGDSGDDPGTPTASPPPASEFRIAYYDAGGNVSVMNSNGSDNRRIVESAGVVGLKSAPSGGLIALDVASGVRVIRTDGSAVFEIPGATAPVWAPVDDRLAVIAAGNVRIVDSSGNPLRDIPQATRPAWSFDGTRIAVVRLDGSLGVPVIVELSTGAETPLSTSIEPHSPDYPIAWHPGGQVIGYRDRLYEPATGVERALPGVSVSFSPDGRMLLVTLPDDPVRATVVGRLLDVSQDLKEVIGLEIPEPGQTPGWLFVQRFTAWTPSGRYLVYLDPTVSRERVRIYDTVEIRQTQYRDFRGDRVVVSPDNVALLYHDSGQLYVLKFDGTYLYEPVDGLQGDWLR